MKSANERTVHCHRCGAGIESVSGSWRHIDDSISAEGDHLIFGCYWGMPYENPATKAQP